MGRERELAELTGALHDAGRRLVTITGIGGLGKTRLALQAALELEGPYAGRVRFAPLAPHRDSSHLVRTIARFLGASERTSPEALATHLAGRPTLLVLDSFEHVLEAASDLEDLLIAIPELQVLATSRERLRIAGEYELALTPLAVPDRSDHGWRDAPATALFLERARDLRSDLYADADLVIDICRRLSGIPRRSSWLPHTSATYLWPPCAPGSRQASATWPTRRHDGPIATDPSRRQSPGVSRR